MERKIVVYGHPDKRPELGFPTEADFEQWIKNDVFAKYHCRYHHTVGMDADVIVLSRDGLAHGHFEIEDKVESNQKDFEDYPEHKFVYVVRRSVLYGKPVRLSDCGIRNFQFGKHLTEAQFDEIKKAAGEIQEYPQ